MSTPALLAFESLVLALEDELAATGPEGAAMVEAMRAEATALEQQHDRDCWAEFARGLSGDP